MGMNITNVFIKKACEALNANMHKLNEEQREELCDKLVALCDEFAPGTFTPVQNNDVYDISDMD